jgi:hypothetical protein
VTIRTLAVTTGSIFNAHIETYVTSTIRRAEGDIRSTAKRIRNEAKLSFIGHRPKTHLAAWRGSRTQRRVH